LRLIVLGLYLIAPDCARWQVRTHAVVNQSEMTLDAAALAADLSEALQLQAEGGASAQLLAMEATLREQQDQLAALEAKAEEERARRHGELSAAKAESEMAASVAARVGEEATSLRQQLEAMCAQRDAACTRVEALSAELADEATDRRELEAALEVKSRELELAQSALEDAKLAREEVARREAAEAAMEDEISRREAAEAAQAAAEERAAQAEAEEDRAAQAAKAADKRATKSAEAAARAEALAAEARAETEGERAHAEARELELLEKVRSHGR